MITIFNTGCPSVRTSVRSFQLFKIKRKSLQAGTVICQSGSLMTPDFYYVFFGKRTINCGYIFFGTLFKLGQLDLSCEHFVRFKPVLTLSSNCNFAYLARVWIESREEWVHKSVKNEIKERLAPVKLIGEMSTIVFLIHEAGNDQYFVRDVCTEVHFSKSRKTKQISS